MKRRFLGVAFLCSVVLLSAQPAGAIGKRSRGECCTPCPTPCPQYTISYVDKKVTCYKPVMKTRDVKVTVNQLVDAKETYKYMVAEPVVTKQKVVVHEMRTKQEPCKYTVMVSQPFTEKVKVCQPKAVVKEIDCVTYERVPKTVMVKKTVRETVCVPVTVTKVIPPPKKREGLFARISHRDDCCDPCPPPPPCPQVVTCTVMKKQVVCKEIEVPCTTYVRVEKKTKRQVTVMEPEWVEKTVTVNKCVPVEKEGMRTVCYTEPVEKVVDVRSCKYVEKVGTRVVKKCVPVEKVVQQSYCEMVPYETTIKVPVCTPVTHPPAPAPKAGASADAAGE